MFSLGWPLCDQKMERIVLGLTKSKNLSHGSSDENEKGRTGDRYLARTVGLSWDGVLLVDLKRQNALTSVTVRN